MPRKKKIDELVVVDLLNRAKGQIDDPIEVNRLLREVGKFYDAMTGKAMIDGVSRAQVIALLEQGEKVKAVAAIDRYIDTFQKRIEPDSVQQSGGYCRPVPTP